MVDSEGRTPYKRLTARTCRAAWSTHRLDIAMNIGSLWKSLPRAARVYLTAVGALSVAGVAGVATVAATSTPLLAAAPSPSPSASPGARQAHCNTFTGPVATHPGKTPAQGQNAISGA